MDNVSILAEEKCFKCRFFVRHEEGVVTNKNAQWEEVTTTFHGRHHTFLGLELKKDQVLGTYFRVPDAKKALVKVINNVIANTRHVYWQSKGFSQQTMKMKLICATYGRFQQQNCLQRGQRRTKVIPRTQCPSFITLEIVQQTGRRNKKLSMCDIVVSDLDTSHTGHAAIMHRIHPLTTEEELVIRQTCGTSNASRHQKYLVLQRLRGDPRFTFMHMQDVDNALARIERSARCRYIGGDTPSTENANNIQGAWKIIASVLTALDTGFIARLFVGQQQRVIILKKEIGKCEALVFHTMEQLMSHDSDRPMNDDNKQRELQKEINRTWFSTRCKELKKKTVQLQQSVPADWQSCVKILSNVTKTEATSHPFRKDLPPEVISEVEGCEQKFKKQMQIYIGKLSKNLSDEKFEQLKRTLATQLGMSTFDVLNYLQDAIQDRKKTKQQRKKASLTILDGKRVLLALTGIANDEVAQLRNQAMNLGASISIMGTVKPQIVVYNGKIETQITKISILTDPLWLHLDDFKKMLQQPVLAGKSDTVESSGAAAKGNESMSPKRQPARWTTKTGRTRKKARRAPGFAAEWSLSQGPTEGNSCIKTQANTTKNMPFSFTPETSNQSFNRCTDIEEKVIDSLAQEGVISSLKQFLINRDVITLEDVETVHLKSISIMTKSMQDRFRRNNLIISLDSMTGVCKQRLRYAAPMGIDGALKSFPISFCLVDSEDSDNMEFILRCIKYFSNRDGKQMNATSLLISDAGAALQKVFTAERGSVSRLSFGGVESHPLHARCWSHYFVLGEMPPLGKELRAVREGIFNWFYRMRSLDTRVSFDTEIACLLYYIKQVLSGDHFTRMRDFALQFYGLRQYYTAAYGDRVGCCGVHTSNISETQHRDVKLCDSLSNNKDAYRVFAAALFAEQNREIKHEIQDNRVAKEDVLNPNDAFGMIARELTPTIQERLKNEYDQAVSYTVEWVTNTKAIIGRKVVSEDCDTENSVTVKASELKLPTSMLNRQLIDRVEYVAGNGDILNPWRYFVIPKAECQVEVIGGSVHCRARLEGDLNRVACSFYREFGIPCRHMLASTFRHFKLEDVPVRFHSAFRSGNFDNLLPLSKAHMQVGISLTPDLQLHIEACVKATSSKPHAVHDNYEFGIVAQELDYSEEDYEDNAFYSASDKPAANAQITNTLDSATAVEPMIGPIIPVNHDPSKLFSVELTQHYQDLMQHFQHFQQVRSKMSMLEPWFYRIYELASKLNAIIFTLKPTNAFRSRWLKLLTELLPSFCLSPQNTPYHFGAVNATLKHAIYQFVIQCQQSDIDEVMAKLTNFDNELPKNGFPNDGLMQRPQKQSYNCANRRGRR